jgi:phosphatidate cytidylyltransferase
VLRTRVLTAIAAALLFLGMLFLAPRGLWAAFVLTIALIGCWEWSRMSGLAGAAQMAYVGASVVVGGFLWLTYLGYVQASFAATAMTGFIVAALLWLVVTLRDVSPWVLLALAAMVWVADIAAYFAGRKFGRRKLAPAISPGKTIEGVYGALAGVALYGVVLAVIAHSASTPLTPIFAPGAGLPAILVMMVLACLSVVGDLFESWMKRGAGLKDSSNLLPGHGGVLDRIDALTSTLPLAALALSLRAL